MGAKDFYNDKIGNRWLYKDHLLQPAYLTDAIKLRTNTFGCRAALIRARTDTPIECQQCRTAPETLGHVLGECPNNKAKIIRRHDDIVEDLANELLSISGTTVIKEPSVNTPSGLLKPDLVVIHKGRWPT